MSKAKWIVLTVGDADRTERIVRRVDAVETIDQRSDGVVEARIKYDAYTTTTYAVRESLADVLAALGVVHRPAATTPAPALSPDADFALRCALGVPPAATEPAPGSDEDWREALRVVQEVHRGAFYSYAEPGVRFDGSAIVWPGSPDIRPGFGWIGCIHNSAPTATAAARSYAASRRADPTPERIAEVRTGQAVDGPLVVDGWTLDLTEWQRGEDNEAAVRMGYDGSGINWRAIKPDGFPLKSGTAPTRADALDAATAALRAHYGRAA